MISYQPYLIAAVIGFPWLGAFLVRLVNDEHPNRQHWLAVSFAVLGAISSLGLIFVNGKASVSIPMGSVFGSLSFMTDGLGILLTIIASTIGSLAVLFSTAYMKGEKQLSRYYSLMLFFIGSMVGLVLSSNLFYTFVFWEITALCSYALISFYNDDPQAVKGGMKAFIITQLGGVGMLVGSLLIYSSLHTLDIPTIMVRLNEIPATILSLAAFGFLVAAVAKSAQVPLHTWLPDAMEAPTPISALIHAATMVNAGVYLLARFYPAFSEVPGWRTAIIIIAASTALLAAIMAAVAYDLKRVLAYSTISQLGYMVYAVGVGDVFASQYHLLSHAVFKALLFLTAGAIIHSLGTRDMRLMGGVGKKMPFIRNVFIIGALALSGIPFLNGFWSKDSILASGFEHGPLWAYLVMLAAAGITAYYSIRCVWLVFFGEPRSLRHAHPVPVTMRIPLLILAIATTSTWLLAGPLANLYNNSLPFHTMHHLTIGEQLAEVFTNPMTYVTLVVIALAVFAFFRTKQMRIMAHGLRVFIGLAENGFGFDNINTFVSRTTLQISHAFQYLQTGVLNWNILGIIVGMIVLLSSIILGGK